MRACVEMIGTKQTEEFVSAGCKEEATRARLDISGCGVSAEEHVLDATACPAACKSGELAAAGRIVSTCRKPTSLRRASHRDARSITLFRQICTD